MMNGRRISRREFIQQTGLAAGGIGGTGISGDWRAPIPSAASAASPAREPVMTMASVGSVLKSYRIWDVHTHLNRFAGATTEEKVEDCLHWADRMGVERMLLLTVASFGSGDEPDHPNPEDLRRMNDECIKAVRKAPDRFFGCAFMNPNYLQACLDEIYRCVRDGPLIGLKFEFDTPRHPDDGPQPATYGAPRDLSVLDPIFQRAGEVNAVIMHHTFLSTLGPQNVGESTPFEIVEVAKRHPKVTVICGHTGGNWELGIWPLRGVKNVYADLSGSDPTSGYTEMAVRELGVEHVVYGSDIEGRSFASQISKVLGANIPDSSRHLILGGNMPRLMEPVARARVIKT
jgi:uncharacterized protein